MIMKAETDGSIMLTYDGASGVTSNCISDVISNCVSGYAIGSVSKADTLESIIQDITKKPEVRVDQRSTLEITNRVIAKYYKDGFFTNSKDLIPAIKSIDVFNENTIKMTFVNGDTQTATVQHGDPYFFEDGLLRCIVKEMIGKEGTAILSKLLSYATDFYNKAEEEKYKAYIEEEDRKTRVEKRHKRQVARWEKKRAKERENRIQEMAEAIARAEEMKRR